MHDGWAWSDRPGGWAGTSALSLPGRWCSEDLHDTSVLEPGLAHDSAEAEQLRHHCGGEGGGGVGVSVGVGMWLGVRVRGRGGGGVRVRGGGGVGVRVGVGWGEGWGWGIRVRE